MRAPSREDVNSMAKWLEAVSGLTTGLTGESSTPNKQINESARMVNLEHVGSNHNLYQDHSDIALHHPTPQALVEPAISYDPMYGFDPNERIAAPSSVNSKPKKLEWEAKLVSSHGANTYNEVICSSSGFAILSDIAMEEVAVKLAQLLNAGQSVSHPTINKLISLDIELGNLLGSAAMWKHRMDTRKSKGDVSGASSAEGRLNAASIDAALKKKEILKMVETL